MPRHLHYVEPFAGGLQVLLARDPGDPRFWIGEASSVRGVSEIANDLHGPLTNFWRVLQQPEQFERFRRTVEAVPFSETEWRDAHAHVHGQDAVADAVAFFIDCRLSLSGRMAAFTGVTRTRTRGNRNNEVNAWLNAVDGLPAVHRRLRDVLILNRPAVEVIRGHDGPHTFFYCDPPYPTGTRTAGDVYHHEMTDDEHRELLDVLKSCQGKVILSSYASELYDAALPDWRRKEIAIANHAAGGATKRRQTEVLWYNFESTG
jgi:DNA adenine methylase